MNLVKFFVKLVKLCRFGHHVLVHEEGRLDLLVTFCAQKVQTIGDQGLVEVDAVVCKEVAAVAGDFCACRWIFEYRGEGMETRERSPRSRSIASNRRRTSWWARTPDFFSKVPFGPSGCHVRRTWLSSWNAAVRGEDSGRRWENDSPPCY